MWLSPLRDRLGLFARTLVNDYFDTWYSAAFLEALLQELPGRVVVIWDGGSMHKGDPIDQLQNLMAPQIVAQGHRGRGGAGGLQWSVRGAPAGLRMNAATGRLSGVPAAA